MKWELQDIGSHDSICTPPSYRFTLLVGVSITFRSSYAPPMDSFREPTYRVNPLDPRHDKSISRRSTGPQWYHMRAIEG